MFLKRANAILTGRFIGKTYTKYRREFIEHFPYGKHIGKILDMKNLQKRPQAQKPILLGLESGKSENQITFSKILKMSMTFAHEISVHKGSDAFPNELTRFRIEATTIWVKIQKHFKNAIII